MTHFNPYLEKVAVVDTPLRPRPHSRVPGWQRMGIILLFIGVIVPLLLLLKPAPAGLEAQVGAHVDTAAQLEAAVSTVPQGERAADDPNVGGGVAAGAPNVPSGDPAGGISPVFAPPVQHWAAQIVAWANMYGLDPNIAATIMQIESCGDPQAVSSAGAQGLFQVMPFHFAAGEDSLDPDTNARRGLNYYVERLQQTNGDVGLAFAGYNGGHRAAGSSWDAWAHETQRYYVWSTGIYGDIQQGLAESPTMQEWLQAGGASLCDQAARRLGLAS